MILIFQVIVGGSFDINSGGILSDLDLTSSKVDTLIEEIKQTARNKELIFINSVLNSSASSLKEGEDLKIKVTSKNLEKDTSIYWQFSGEGIDKDDLGIDSITGSSKLDANGIFELQYKIKEDDILEGTEQLHFKMFSMKICINKLELLDRY